MSCPDWKRLARERQELSHPFTRESGDSPEWREALGHLDSGCPACRKAALAADPLLVFRRLPAPQMSPEQEDREVADMQRAVAAMRTASRLEGPARSSLNWRRWAAAAGLAFLALAAGPWRSPGERPAPLAQRGPAAVPAALAVDGASLIEAVENRPNSRVYEMDSGGMTVAMVFDESFEL